MKVSSKPFHDKVRNLDWGPCEFGSRESSKEGSIMSLATREAITIQKSNSIKHAAEMMAENNIRRLWVTEPDGTLVGILTAKDVVDFLGGGDRFLIIHEKHKDNLPAAINEPVRLIMTEAPTTLSVRNSLDEALKLMHKEGRGSVPLLDNGKLAGIITETAFAHTISKNISNQKVSEFMSKDVIFGTEGMKIKDIAKVMVRNGFRRLPILRERELAGVVTTRDIITQFAENFSADILERRVSKFMKKPTTVSPNDLIADAAELMRKHDIGGLPVVEGEKVVGILTEKDLLKTVE
jgi:CBS domain-containing protein